MRTPDTIRALAACALAAMAQGCVSTEALYAEYDEHACLAVVEPAPLAALPALPEIAPEAVARADVPVAAVVAPVSGLTTSPLMLWEPAVGFALREASLDALAIERLDRDVAVLHAYPTLRVGVRGFTDARGSAALNLELATRRVRSVAAYLQERGIDPGRIDQVPFGEGLPLVGLDGAQSVPEDRRVELLLIDARGRPVPLHVPNALALEERLAESAEGGR